MGLSTHSHSEWSIGGLGLSLLRDGAHPKLRGERGPTVDQVDHRVDDERIELGAGVIQ